MDLRGLLGGVSQDVLDWDHRPPMAHPPFADSRAPRDLNLRQGNIDTAHQAYHDLPLPHPRLPSVFEHYNAPSDGDSRTQRPSGDPARPPSQARYNNVSPLLSESMHTVFSVAPATYSTTTFVGRRNISKSLDWEGHKSQIKQIYLDNDGTLDQTMRYMQEHFNFKASEKLYKAKFKEWNWSKHLSGTTARWMLNQAQKRGRDDKATVFKLGEQVLSMEQIHRSAERSEKRSKLPFNGTAGQTPANITYHTPSASAPSPFYTSPAGPATPPPISNEIEDDTSYPRYTWRGHAKGYFDELRTDGQRLESGGKNFEAQAKYRDALSGYQNLLPHTHYNTVSLVYELASLYAKIHNMREADEILEWMTKAHVKGYGLWDRRTVQHINKVVRMLQIWQRENEAVPLIDHLLQGQGDQPRTTAVSMDHVEDFGIEHQLAQADVLALADSDLIEVRLVPLVERCEDRPTDSPLLTMRAWAALVRAYVGKQDNVKQEDTLNRAEASIHSVLEMKNSTWSIDLFQSALTLLAMFVEADRHEFASTVLSRIEEKVVYDFRDQDEKRIRVLADIGMLYQDKGLWEHARPFFEHAQAVSAGAYGRKDERTKAFEDGLEKGRYEPLQSFGLKA